MVPNNSVLVSPIDRDIRDTLKFSENPIIGEGADGKIGILSIATNKYHMQFQL